MSKRKFNLDGKTLRRVLRDLKHYRIALVFSLLLAAGYVVLSLLIPLETGRAIDHILGKGAVNRDGVLHSILLIGIYTAASALFLWVMNVLNNRITYGMVRRLRREAFAKLQRLPLSYLDSREVHRCR